MALYKYGFYYYYSSLAMFEAAIRVKSTHLIKLCLKTTKKEKYGNKIYFSHKFTSKRSLTQRIQSLLRRADATGSVDIIYRF